MREIIFYIRAVTSSMWSITASMWAFAGALLAVASALWTDGEKEKDKKVYLLSDKDYLVSKMKKVYPTSEPFPKQFTRFPKQIFQ